MLGRLAVQVPDHLHGRSLQLLPGQPGSDHLGQLLDDGTHGLGAEQVVPGVIGRHALRRFHARAEVDVLGIELVFRVGVPVEGDAVLDTERFELLVSAVARLRVR